jgi:creatinine amidohydrolase
MASQHDYVVYIHPGSGQPNTPDRPKRHTTVDSHAGETETSHTMISRPDLVHMDRVPTENGADLNRLDLPANVYTGIWWYAKFPNHYAGDAAPANQELGDYDMKAWAASIAATIRAVKADQTSPRLQREFLERSTHPIDTKQ